MPRRRIIEIRPTIPTARRAACKADSRSLSLPASDVPRLCRASLRVGEQGVVPSAFSVECARRNRRQLSGATVPIIKVGRSGSPAASGRPDLFVVATVPAAAGLAVRSRDIDLDSPPPWRCFPHGVASAAITALQARAPPGDCRPAATAPRRAGEVRRDLTRDLACAAPRRATHRPAPPCGIVPLAWVDPLSAALAAIVDPPLVLWFRGRVAAFDDLPWRLSARARQPRTRTQRGRAIGNRCGLSRRHSRKRPRPWRRLAAHAGRSTAAAATVAVFGCGVDVVYPAEHDSSPVRSSSARRHRQ